MPIEGGMIGTREVTRITSRVVNPGTKCSWYGRLDGIQETEFKTEQLSPGAQRIVPSLTVFLPGYSAPTGSPFLSSQWIRPPVFAACARAKRPAC